MEWVRSRWMRYGLAIAAALVGVGASALLAPVMGEATPTLLIAVPLVLVASFAGTWPTLLAVGLCGLMADYFLISPRYSLRVASADDMVRLGVFLATGIMVAALSGLIYRSRRRGELERERLRAVLEVLPVGVYLADADGRIVKVNAAAEAIWGRRHHADGIDAYGNDYTAFWSATGEPLNAKDWGLARALSYGEVSSAEELDIVAADGQRKTILNYAAPIREASGQIAGGVAVNVDITDRTQAEGMLRDSERRFRGTFENAAVGMTHTDDQGRFLRVNEMFVKLLGYERGELEGRSYAEFTHPDDAREEEDLYRQLFAGEISSYTRDKRYLRHDGSVAWVSLTRALQPAADGAPAYSINVVQDVSARKAAEQAMQAAHQRLVDTLNSIADGFLLLDHSLTVTEINPAGQRFLGKTRGEAIGSRLADVFPHSQTGHEGEEYRQAMQTGRHTAFEKYFPEMGLWFDIRAYPTPDGIALYFQDITERRKDQEALRKATREARERALEAEEGRSVLQAMMEHVPMGLIVADGTGGVRFSSRYPIEWADITKIDSPVGQAQSDTWVAYRPGEGAPAGYPALPLARAIKKGEVVHGEEWVLRKGDDAVSILANAAPIRNEAGDIIGGVVGWQDISHVKAAQEAAAEANRAKDHFLAVLSHELRTPLTPVIAAAGMLQEDSRLPEDVKQDMQMMRRNVELEKRLIDDLLDLTRIRRGKLEMHFRPVDAVTVLRRAVEVCQPDIINKGLHLVLDLPESALMVMADEARLQQVFWNLIHNAMKFTPTGGRITVRCAADSAGHIVGEVSDTGVGIDPKAIGRIFDAFEQQDRDVTRQFGGLGLGLAICKEIISQHDGSIRARSPGRGMGSMFIVELHRLEAVPLMPPEEEGPGPETTAPQGKLRILLVEDHADTARILKRLLKRNGYDVEVAGDVASALQSASGRAFDLLVSDLGLPDGSGLDLMRKLRDRGANVRGIAISGYGQQSDIERSRDAGFIEHVTKPVDIDQLLAAVARVATA